MRTEDTSLLSSLCLQAQPIDNLKAPNLDQLMARIGDSRVVLLGESTHGTSEFYSLRAAITERLVKEKGFRLVGLEADWPDMEKVNAFVQGEQPSWNGFARFPEWMWRNREFCNFTKALREHNSQTGSPVSVFGLDLYSLSASLEGVLEFFEANDPEAAHQARSALDCLEPWIHEPSRYGLSVWRDYSPGCRTEILNLLKTMHEERVENFASPRTLLSALQNSRIAANAEEYYRVMYESSVESWNLRDRHMFETLLLLLDHHGPQSKAVIWEHNSHLGNASATQMSQLGEFNVGQLCRNKFGADCYSIGFMTDTGLVAAASRWDGPMEFKSLRSAREDSFEALFHRISTLDPQLKNYFMPLRSLETRVAEALSQPRLERAVGVLYLPETERQSHYFWARLPEQFDEICWVDKSSAIHAMTAVPAVEEAEMIPFGL